eukprot:4691689-Pyramimonas_sp.AAC.1
MEATAGSCKISAPLASGPVAGLSCSLAHFHNRDLIDTQTLLLCWKTTTPGPVHLSRCSA